MNRRASIPCLPVGPAPDGGESEPPFFWGKFESELQEKPERRAFHRHHMYEVFLMTDGKGIFHCDFASFPFAPMRLIFVSPGQVHGWDADATVRGHVVAFSSALWEYDGRGAHLLNRLPFFFAPLATSQLHIPAALREHFTERFSQIAVEFGRGVNANRGILRALLELILLEAERLVPNPRGISGDVRLQQIVRPFLFRLEGDFAGSRKLDAHAQALGISERQLSETVKRVLGKSPRSLIEERLFLEARRLLVHAPQSVAEIAFALGFDDASHFSRFFRRHAACSPRAFREREGGA